MNGPRSLEELLSHFDKAPVKDPDTAIKTNQWAKRFRSYLENNEQGEVVTALRFLVLTQVFEPNSRASVADPDLLATFIRTSKMFFSEESEDCVTLSNPRLFEAISEAGRQKQEALTKDMVRQMLLARHDADVWQKGVEEEYIRFVSTQKSTIACLLSIL